MSKLTEWFYKIGTASKLIGWFRRNVVICYPWEAPDDDYYPLGKSELKAPVKIHLGIPNHFGSIFFTRPTSLDTIVKHARRGARHRGRRTAQKG